MWKGSLKLRLHYINSPNKTTFDESKSMRKLSTGGSQRYAVAQFWHTPDIMEFFSGYRRLVAVLSMTAKKDVEYYIKALTEPKR